MKHPTPSALAVAVSTLAVVIVAAGFVNEVAQNESQRREQMEVLRGCDFRT